MPESAAVLLAARTACGHTPTLRSWPLERQLLADPQGVRAFCERIECGDYSGELFPVYARRCEQVVPTLRQRPPPTLGVPRRLERERK